MSEENKALVRRFLEEGWGQGDASAIEQIVAADAVDHNPGPGQPPGVEGFVGAVQAIRAGLPDLQVTVDDLFAEGDRVAARWTSKGMHRGELMGVPATGNQVTIAGIDIHRIEGGKIAELWHQVDVFGMLQQIGAIPSQ
jgi:steroid delta-isomerase-like uncharacterized protein